MGIVKKIMHLLKYYKIRNPTIQIVDVSDTKEGLERVSSGELVWIYRYYAYYWICYSKVFYVMI
jgi:hypothetical protein